MAAPPRHWPIVSTLSRWYRNWNTARKGGFELQCAGAAEVERIAQELGLSSFELQNLVSHPDERELLAARMEMMKQALETARTRQEESQRS